LSAPQANHSPEDATAFAAELVSTPAGRRSLAAASPTFFDTYYCGMWRAAHRDRWLSIATRTIDNARRDGQRKNRLLLLAPRDHGKTELTITIALRELCKDRDIRILWISESAEVGKKRLQRISSLLKSPRIVEDWASEPEAGCLPFKASGKEDAARWTQTAIYVQRLRKSVDPSIEAVGSGGAITGGHFDLILCDDLESDKTTLSIAGRAKTRGWFNGTVTPMLSPGGTFIIIGTRKHHDDLYGHLSRRASWRVIEDPAIIQWPEDHSIIKEYDPELQKEIVTGVDVVGPSKVLWPQHRPIEYLLEERDEITPLVFAREFQHQVQDDSSAPFKMEWLQRAQDRGAHLSLDSIPEGVKGLEIVQGWDFSLVTDPAKAASQDSDYTVGITWGRDANGDRYLLGLKRIRGLSPSGIRGAVLAEFQKFGGLGRVHAVAVERNAFGELHYIGLQKTTDLPIKGHLTTKKKADYWDGVPSLRGLFEAGKVVFPSRLDSDKQRVGVMIQELWALGRELHDDTVMALWIAETVLRKGAFTYRAASDEDDIVEGNAAHGAWDGIYGEIGIGAFDDEF